MPFFIPLYFLLCMLCSLMCVNMSTAKAKWRWPGKNGQLSQWAPTLQHQFPQGIDYIDKAAVPSVVWSWRVLQLAHYVIKLEYTQCFLMEYAVCPLLPYPGFISAAQLIFLLSLAFRQWWNWQVYTKVALDSKWHRTPCHTSFLLVLCLFRYSVVKHSFYL